MKAQRRLWWQFARRVELSTMGSGSREGCGIIQVALFTRPGCGRVAREPYRWLSSCLSHGWFIRTDLLSITFGRACALHSPGGRHYVRPAEGPCKVTAAKQSSVMKIILANLTKKNCGRGWWIVNVVCNIKCYMLLYDMTEIDTLGCFLF
jgi:hypothetical protein